MWRENEEANKTELLGIKLFYKNAEWKLSQMHAKPGRICVINKRTCTGMPDVWLASKMVKSVGRLSVRW